MAAVTAAAVGAAGAVGSAYMNKEAAESGSTGSTSRRTQIPGWLNDASKQAVGLGQDIADKRFDPEAANNAYGLNDIQDYGVQQGQSLKGAYQPWLDSAGQTLQAADRQFPDADLSSYVNPYVEGVLDVSAGNMSDAFAQQQNQRDANAANAGAFGGMRAELGKSNAEDNYLSSIGDLYQQGMGQAWDQGASRWAADRSYQQQMAGQYQNLGQVSANLQSQNAQSALRSGQVKQNSALQQYIAERDWDKNQRLQPLLSAASSVPHGGSNLTQTQGTQTQQGGGGSALAAGIGGGLAGYGIYNQFSGGGGGGVSSASAATSLADAGINVGGTGSGFGLSQYGF